MGASGRVFNIAENIGLLKHKMWKEGIAFITPAPTAVKKLFTGKGNSNKTAMYDAFLNKGLDVDLEKLLNCASDKSPLADITDAYAMCDYFINNPNN
jgi:Holliday junction resolvasome RuvABC endonuclease subunit